MPFTKTFLSYFLLSGICLNSLQRKIHLFIYLCYSNFAFNFTEIFSKILQTFILQTLESIIKIEIDENTENKGQWQWGGCDSSWCPSSLKIYLNIIQNVYCRVWVDLSFHIHTDNWNFHQPQLISSETSPTIRNHLINHIAIA